MASAAARLLFLAGFQVVVLEREQPLAVRRLVSFAQAVLDGAVDVEGVPGRRIESDPRSLLAGDFVPVSVDPHGLSLARLQPQAVIDARMAKRNLGSARSDARLVVGLGPGFVAGLDVHAVVETQRGPSLGAVIWSGAAAADTRLPAEVMGFRDERVLRAPRGGAFRGLASIGGLVAAGEVVGEVEGETVRAGVSGLVRGLLADGVRVDAGLKVGDIDPRGAAVDPARISDKARAVAAGVLEAVLVGLGSAGR
jgi:xanthine dehydrogenase accessory factor